MNKETLKVGDILTGIPFENKGNKQTHNLEILEIYEFEGKKRFRIFSLTGTISYPGMEDWGRELVLNEEEIEKFELL